MGPLEEIRRAQATEQSPELDHFLDETFQMSVPPQNSLVDDVHEDRVFNVWRQNPGAVDHAAALAGDEQLRAFTGELENRFLFVDLREPAIGVGSRGAARDRRPTFGGMARAALRLCPAGNEARHPRAFARLTLTCDRAAQES